MQRPSVFCVVREEEVAATNVHELFWPHSEAKFLGNFCVSFRGKQMWNSNSTNPKVSRGEERFRSTEHLLKRPTTTTTRLPIANLFACHDTVNKFYEIRVDDGPQMNHDLGLTICHLLLKAARTAGCDMKARAFNSAENSF